MPEYEDDARWSRRFLPELKRLIGEHLVAEASWEEDAKHNTDLIVLTLDQLRVACRVRRHRYWRDYGDQFTLRCSRPGGVKTELEKVMDGWGDYLLYGFADVEARTLHAWLLGDLRVFRRWWLQQCAHASGDRAPGQHRQNEDGSSSFRSFSVEALPPQFIVARHRPLLATANGDRVPPPSVPPSAPYGMCQHCQAVLPRLPRQELADGTKLCRPCWRKHNGLPAEWAWPK